VNERTALSANFARPRRNDPVQPALEADSKHVFIRITPPGLSLEDTEGLLGRSGYLVKLVNSGPRFAKATFVDEVRAGKALEFVRNYTNLVANFFRFSDRLNSNEQDYDSTGKRKMVYKKSSFTHINPRGFIPRPATPDFGSTGYPEAAPAAIPDATLRRSNSMGAKEPPSQKEWPGVRLTTVCLGSSLMLNPLVLFGREPGFLRLLLENDQSCVALFETEAEASIASSHLSRMILKPRTDDGPGPVTQVNRTMPHISKGRDSDPTDVVRISPKAGVDEKLVELLVAACDGFQSCNKDRTGNIIAQFSSISRAKKALEELRTNTSLTADFADSTISEKSADVTGQGSSESDSWSTSRHGQRRESFNQPRYAGRGSWRGGYRESHSYRGNNGDEYGNVGGSSGWSRRGQGYRGGGRGRGGGFHKPMNPEPQVEVNAE
ncbi:hypothetical protein HK405_012779, partial [Cladochytrium tenue]